MNFILRSTTLSFYQEGTLRDKGFLAESWWFWIGSHDLFKNSQDRDHSTCRLDPKKVSLLTRDSFECINQIIEIIDADLENNRYVVVALGSFKHCFFCRSDEGQGLGFVWINNKIQTNVSPTG